MFKGKLTVAAYFFFGKDKKNNVTIVIKVKQRVPGAIPIEETKKFIIFLIKEAIKRADQAGMSGKFTIIWDRQGFTRKNSCKQVENLLKNIGKMLQDVYLERLD